jgi:hypothetical protein
MNESADTIHGRMKEGAHIAGYSLERAMSNLKWLLEESRFEKLSAGYGDVNDFLRDTKEAFKLLRIDPEERKQIATLVKDLQPKASQRAIADMVGADHLTIGRDLGKEYGSKEPKEPEKQVKIGSIEPRPWTADDGYDPTLLARSKEKRLQREAEIQKQIEEIESGEIELPVGVFETIVIDPPWPYGTHYDPDGRRAASPYPEMSLEELIKLELPAADDCILWLWTTHKKYMAMKLFAYLSMKDWV